MANPSKIFEPPERPDRHTHTRRQGVSLASPNCNNTTKLQEREWGAAVGNFDLHSRVPDKKRVDINGQKGGRMGTALRGGR